MITRTLLAAVLLVVLGAGAADAQEYPPQPDFLTVSDSTVFVGQTITVTARTFQPGSTVQFAINPPLGSGTANADGIASISATIPSLSAGQHTITATGVDTAGAPLTVSGTVTVVVPAEAPLPVTGANSLPLARIGIVAVAAGGLLVLFSRKRRAAIAA
ncbi:MAG: LPXTG cell wall anchor domain-containing protein [Acidimicrobiales bacterium]